MTEEQVYLNAVETWRVNKGKGSFMIPAPFDALRPLLYILPQLYNKSPTTNVIIVVKDFVDRSSIENYLTTLNNEVWNNSFRNLICNGNLKILTSQYVAEHINEYSPLLTIVYNPDIFHFAYMGMIEKSKFNLVILTRKLDNKTMDDFYTVAPSVGNFSQNVIDEVRSNRPVKEYLVGLTIEPNSELDKEINYYNREISTAIAIFGDFDNIKYARLGNSATNCSSMMVCDAIARTNGWDNHLDMSSEFNRDIDKLYSPAAIKERADSIYNIIRERSTKLASSKDKLNSILEIVNNHLDKNILIVSKYSEFANLITDYLNDNFGKRICANYHDKVDNVPAVDDYGNPILVKSGPKKGKPRLLGVIAQKKLAQKLMNTHKINVISCGASPDKTLDVDIDLVIITSPLCDTIESYFYRLSKVHFANEVLLYTLFYKGTLEEKKLEDRATPINHTTINDFDRNVKVDNNNDCCIVD